MKSIRVSKKQTVKFNLILAVIGLWGCIVVLYSSHLGAGLSDDSYYYIAPVRDWMAGEGLNLFPHFPPLLPMILSLIGITGIDPLLSIRWLNAIFFGLSSVMAGQLVWRLVGSQFAAIITSIFFICTSHLIEIHSWAMSESTYILLMYFGFLSFQKNTQNPNPEKKLPFLNGPFLTGLCFGLAALTRYIGFSLLLASGIVWLFFSSKQLITRINNALIFSVTGILPNLIWFMRNINISGQPTNRTWLFHAAPLDWWREGFRTILIWFIPGRFVQGLELYWLLISLMAIFCLLFWISRKNFISLSPITNQEQTLKLMAISIQAYFIILVFSRTLLDPRIPSDYRLLAPVLSIVIPLITILAVQLWYGQTWLGKLVATLIILVPLTTNTIRSVETVQSYHTQGRGYASARNHISETYAYLRRFPETPIYSNAYAGIYFWTGRKTNIIPGHDRIQLMKDELRINKGLLVVFDSIPLELYQVSYEALTEDLVEVIRLSEATILKYP